MPDPSGNNLGILDQKRSSLLVFICIVSGEELCYCLVMKFLRRLCKGIIILCLLIGMLFFLIEYAGKYISWDGPLTIAATSASPSSSAGPAEPLVFDASTYPYYDQLNEVQKALYQEFYDNASSLNEMFLPQEDITSSDVETVFRCLFCDHPELFWLDTKYNYRSLSDSDRVISISLSYNETASDIDAAKQRFEHAGNEILVAAEQCSSAYEKEKYVHDALIEKTEYDVSASLNQSAYSALVNGRTVCAGYARSFQYLLQKLGIPCYYVIGTSEGQDHAWNIVLLDGAFYNVDLTWDDCASADDPYYFFNLDDAAFNEYHTRTSMSTLLPSCTSTLLAHKEDPQLYQYMRFSIPQ